MIDFSSLKKVHLVWEMCLQELKDQTIAASVDYARNFDVGADLFGLLASSGKDEMMNRCYSFFLI